MKIWRGKRDEVFQLAAERTNALVFVVQMVREIGQQLAMIIPFMVRSRIGANDDAITCFDQSITIIVDAQLILWKIIPLTD